MQSVLCTRRAMIAIYGSGPGNISIFLPYRTGVVVCAHPPPTDRLLLRGRNSLASCSRTFNIEVVVLSDDVSHVFRQGKGARERRVKFVRDEHFYSVPLPERADRITVNSGHVELDN